MVEETVNLKCRFYENVLPNDDELVVVRIERVEDNGAYVKLLEYNEKDGFIVQGEYSKLAHLRSVHKIIKVGKQEVVQVIRVDREKEYIDLSKKRVQPNQIKEAEEKFAKSRQVNTIVRHIAEKMKIDIQHIYEKIVWPLSREYEHALEAFKISLMQPEKIFDHLDCEKEIKNKLHQEIIRRLTPQAVRVRADFEITCFAYEGIDAIKEALNEGIKKSQMNCEIKYQIIAPPLYVAITMCYDKNLGIQTLQESLQAVEQTILAKKGNFLIKAQPRVVGDKGEKDIQDLIDILEKQKAANDDSDEDNDEGMADVDIGVDVDAIDREELEMKQKGGSDDEDDS